jgi:hypothetical protein
MSAAFARKCRQEHRQAEQRKNLQQQVNAYRMNLQLAENKIEELKKELAAAMRERDYQNLIQTPAERIYLDILKNHGRDPHGRRYCVETLAWAEEIHMISPQALEVVGKVIPVPSESLINSKFTKTRQVISDALQDSDRLGELINLWDQSGARSRSERTVVLAVDAVAFRPLVTVTENGEVAGLKRLTQLDSPDLFTEFLRDPQAFSNFLQQHWKQAYSALHAFHIQPVNPKFPCCVIHVYPAENGKGNDDTRKTLLNLKTKLETEFGITVIGLAFDGDSCWSPLHAAFAEYWREWVRASPREIPRIPFGFVLICDPLHLLKRIRYRLLQLAEVFLTEESLHFCLQVIQDGHILSPVVFDNSHESKMHDSLPLELFSLKTLQYILENPVVGETMLAPWCFLVIALTQANLSTRERRDLLETGLWMLFLYENPELVPDPPSNPNVKVVHPKRFAHDDHTLYTNDQFRDALNTFIALIMLIDGLDGPICLNRFGSNPLEHAFGHARIRCRDVNYMEKLIAALAGNYTISNIEHFLAIAAEPKRRRSVGVTCKPIARTDRRIVQLAPQLLARSLLVRSANPPDLVNRFDGTPPLVVTAWEDLLKLFPLAISAPEAPPGKSLTARPVSPKPGRLSSNQIFLGFAKSPRPAHLIKSPSKMSQALKPVIPPG